MSDYAPTPVEDFLDPDHPTLFPRLTPEQIEYLAEIGTRLTYARGDVVFEHGQRETPLFVVESGAIPKDLMGLDIGPATVAHFADALRDSRTIIWNGPMGVFERPPFAAGTLGLAQAVAAAPGLSVIGGGDTVAAVQTAGVADRIGYLSTGGGAFLEYLEGRTLPGVAALDDA